MAHQSQLEFITTVVSAFPEKFSGKHLEIGSEDINGTLENIIKCNEYVGVDLRPGKNVTLVGRGEEIDLPSGYFDSVLSGECFEHNRNYLSSLFNMIRMTKPGGIVVFTCASRFRMEHGTTRSDGGSGAPSSVAAGNEYYLNLVEKHFRPVIREELFSNYKFYRNFSEQDIYFIGIKKTKSSDSSLESRFELMNLEISQQIKRMNKFSRIFRINMQLLKMAIIRLTINYLYRNFSNSKLNILKKLLKRGVVQN